MGIATIIYKPSPRAQNTQTLSPFLRFSRSRQVPVFACTNPASAQPPGSQRPRQTRVRFFEPIKGTRKAIREAEGLDT